MHSSDVESDFATQKYVFKLLPTDTLLIVLKS